MEAKGISAKNKKFDVNFNKKTSDQDGSHLKLFENSERKAEKVEFFFLPMGLPRESKFCSDKEMNLANVFKNQVLERLAKLDLNADCMGGCVEPQPINMKKIVNIMKKQPLSSPDYSVPEVDLRDDFRLQGIDTNFFISGDNKLIYYSFYKGLFKQDVPDVKFVDDTKRSLSALKRELSTQCKVNEKFELGDPSYISLYLAYFPIVEQSYLLSGEQADL